MRIDPNKPFQFVCGQHNCPLIPDGHGVGLGGESWPGIYLNHEELSWSLSTDELLCPFFDDEEEEGEGENDDGEEEEDCQGSWTIAQPPIYSTKIS